MFFWDDPLFDPVILVTQILSILVILCQSLLVLGVLGIIIHKVRPNPFTTWAGNMLYTYGLLAALIVSTAAMVGSLYFSEIAHYTPCLLCWYQRIAIFPLPFLLGVGLLRKERSVFWYILPQVIIGLGISIYHYFHQIWAVVDPLGAPQLGCGVVGFTPSCTGHFFLEYGYITIPIMAMTTLLTVLFLAIFTLVYGHYKVQNRQAEAK